MSLKFKQPPAGRKQTGRTAGTGLPWLMGLIFIGIGVYIMLAGLGITSIGKLLVAPWIIVVCGLIFALFGVALIFQMVTASSQAPILDRSGKNQVILPEERPAKLVQSWIFTVIWDGLVGVFWYLILSGAKGEGDMWVAYVVLGIFTPIGVALLYWSIKITMSAMRFGLIPLQLQPATASNQRLLKARLQVPRKDVLTVINAKLICYTVRWERVQSSKGTRISQSRNENWNSGLQRIRVRPGSSMDISITIPPYLPATTTSLNAGNAEVNLDTDYFAWLLEVTADVPGVDLYRSYEVPVPAATAEMLSNVEPEPDVNAAEQVLKKAAAVRTVAEADFNAGKSADEIANKLLKQGLASSIIQAGMQQIADNPAALHRGQAQIWVAQQNKMQSEIDGGQLMMLRRPAEPRLPHPRTPAQVQNTGQRAASNLGGALAGNLHDNKGHRQYSASPGLDLGRLLIGILPILIFGYICYRGYTSIDKRANETRQQDGNTSAATQANIQPRQQRLNAAAGPTGNPAENTAPTKLKNNPGAAIATSPVITNDWYTYYDRANAAKQQKRNTEAERLFQNTLDFIRQKLGQDHPAMARTLVSRADLYRNMEKSAQYEQDMQQAYTILDRYPDSNIKQELGVTVYALDKEEVARWLGDYYWDAYRYADSFKFYQLAYAAAPALQTTDYNRNSKLAFSSSGVMKTACTLGKWDIADKAMAELKQRYKNVDANSQKQLDYWIQTGEPRLKNRSC